MTCLQLCVLFNFQICGTFPPVFMNIFLRSRLPCTNALSVLLFSGHGEFETGLLPTLVCQSLTRQITSLPTRNSLWESCRKKRGKLYLSPKVCVSRLFLCPAFTHINLRFQHEFAFISTFVLWHYFFCSDLLELFSALPTRDQPRNRMGHPEQTVSTCLPTTAFVI